MFPFPSSKTHQGVCEEKEAPGLVPNIPGRQRFGRLSTFFILEGLILIFSNLLLFL